MSLTDYADTIRNTIFNAPFVLSHSLTYEDRPPLAGILSGHILFADLSRLQFKEFLHIADPPIRLKYSYPYLSSTSVHVFRYDNPNEPASKRFNTYPHHKHLLNKHLVPSAQPTLQDILGEIARSIKL